LKDQIHVLEVHLKAKETMEDREVMTDPLKLEKQEKCKGENTELEADMPVSQNKNRHSKEFSKDGSEVGGTSLYISNQCTAVSGTCSPNEVLLVRDQSLQEAFNEKPADQKIMAVENLLAENRELRRQLEAVRFELEKFHTKTVSHEVQLPKTGAHNIQTMTDPDIEFVHMSMENAALQAQLQQLSKECEEKGDELERMSILLKELREASSSLLRKPLDAHTHDNTVLKKEQEDVKRTVKHQEQEILKSKIDTTIGHQPIKIAELLLDRLKKENIELQAQLTEREGKEKTEYGCHNLRQNQEISKDHSVGNIDDRVATNMNLDSLAHLLSMHCPVPLEETQQSRTLGLKVRNVENVDKAMQSQTSTLLPACNVAAADQVELKAPDRTNDMCESELSFSDVSSVNRAKENLSVAEHKFQIPVNANRKKKELQNDDLTNSQISKYFEPSVQRKYVG
jgi:hypothetical protein